MVCITIAGCREHKAPFTATILCYNAENLFDTIHKRGLNDSDFTPLGAYHYGTSIYNQRIEHLATVIASVSDNKHHSFPALVGLAEVENNTVLQSVIAHPLLSGNNYQFIITHGNDKRGMNVALVYDTTLFHVFNAKELPVLKPNGKDTLNTRNILKVSGTMSGDTFTVFVNHWPSHRSDSNGTTGRLLAATTLMKELEQPALKNTNFIVLGDFNCNPDDSLLKNYLHLNDSGTNNGLKNLCTGLYAHGKGTEYYRGNWNFLDQVWVRAGLQTHTAFGGLKVINSKFLTTKQGAPKRAFLGNKYTRGYSDHYPVLLQLTQKEKPAP